MADKPVCTPVCGSPGDSPFRGEPPESDKSRDEAEDHPWVVLSGGNEERRPVDVAYKLIVAPSGLLGVRTPDGEPQQTAAGASKQQTLEKTPLLLPEATLPKLQTPRYGHVTCVTSGHEVLLVGGRDGQTVLNSVERFEETEERWVSMPSLHFARAHHAGCAVSGGRAVVLGGENEKGVLKSVELYHPVKRNWINLAPLQHQRHSFGAVAIGSNIFALGGRDAAGDHGRVLKTVEGLAIAPLSSPSCSRSSSLATAPSSPAGVSADAVAQGSPGVHTPQAPQQGTACDRAEPLHAVQGAGKQACSGEGGASHGAEGWQSLPSMKHGRASFGVAQYRGLIFCAGGTNGVKPLSSVEMFDSSTNEWFELPSLNEARIGPICFVWLKGPERRPHLCVAGGRQSSLHPVFQSVEVLDLLPLLPSTQEASANKTQSTAGQAAATGQAAAGSAKKRAEQTERETATPAAEWVLVGSAGVKLCWQQAAGVVAACWKVRGERHRRCIRVWGEAEALDSEELKGDEESKREETEESRREETEESRREETEESRREETEESKREGNHGKSEKRKRESGNRHITEVETKCA
ncbi:kelch repeat-containing protein [Toxoplasma gondii MAS]|uniref:Kelch repeat-containing protein n=1 Tax=Toxoplasma gondii MAS TaxID=943118 RepID=A0A086QWG3_TOXGO|nr:kelch repeat-containing protein [Toxoplasma gondii MAS]